MAKYSVVTLEKRTELINNVQNLGKGLTKIAKKLRIKLSTAKSILRIYRKSGKILPKKSKVLNTKKIRRQQRIKQIQQQKQIINLQKVQTVVKAESDTITPFELKSNNNNISNEIFNFQQQQHIMKLRKQLEFQLYCLTSRYQMEKLMFERCFGLQVWLAQQALTNFIPQI